MNDSSMWAIVQVMEKGFLLKKKKVRERKAVFGGPYFHMYRKEKDIRIKKEEVVKEVPLITIGFGPHKAPTIFSNLAI